MSNLVFLAENGNNSRGVIYLRKTKYLISCADANRQNIEKKGMYTYIKVVRSIDDDVGLFIFLSINFFRYFFFLYVIVEFSLRVGTICDLH